MDEPEESALVVLVPQADPLISRFRAEFDRSAARGMPAHVTLLYPFLHPDRISEKLTSELRALFSQRDRFSFSLVGVAGFPTVVYLAPEPLDPFDTLTRTLAARFPDTPPYGGAFDPVPHLTVAQTPPAPSLAAVSDEVFAAVSSCLPLECEVREVTLVVKREGKWAPRRSFPLADPHARGASRRSVLGGSR